jgi:hypothetical protein
MRDSRFLTSIGERVLRHNRALDLGSHAVKKKKGCSVERSKLWPNEVLPARTLISSIAVLPDGRLASAGEGGYLKLWRRDRKASQ